MKIYIKFTLFFVLVAVLSGCIKTQTKTHWDLLSRKDGVWNVDKFTVNWFTPNGVHASKTEVFENAGEFTFVRT